MRAASCDNESRDFSNASTTPSPLTKASTTQSQRISALRNNHICVETVAPGAIVSPSSRDMAGEVSEPRVTRGRRGAASRSDRERLVRGRI
jgi:hypothetical protein